MANPQLLHVGYNGLHALAGQNTEHDVSELPGDDTVRAYEKDLARGERDYRVASFRAGYAGVGCRVAFKDNNVLICGYDGETNIRLGNGNCQKSAFEVKHAWSDYRVGDPVLVTLPPDMPLAALSLLKHRGGYESVALTRCLVIYASSVESDDESCLSKVRFPKVPTGQDSIKEMVFYWPSGSKTHLQISYDGPHYKGTSHNTKRTFRINGEITELSNKADLREEA